MDNSICNEPSLFLLVAGCACVERSRVFRCGHGIAAVVDCSHRSYWLMGTFNVEHSYSWSVALAAICTSK